MARHSKRLNRIITDANQSAEELSRVSSPRNDGGQNGQSSTVSFGTEHGESSRSRVTRGPTKMLHIWSQPSNERISVQANWKNQAVGPGSYDLKRFMGVIARNSRLCPLGYESWLLLPNTTKMAAISVIKQKFSYPASLEKFVAQGLGKMWKDYKSDLKGKYYHPEKSEFENAKNVPRNVCSLDWQFLVKYWKSGKGKAREVTNKRNRSLQKSDHTTGSKSIANLQFELEIQKERVIGEVELYRASRTQKDGRIISNGAAEKVRMAEELLAQKSGASQSNRQAIEIEVMIEVLGKNLNSNSRVPGMGFGVTQSNLQVPILLNKRTEELENQVNVLKSLMSKVINELDTVKNQVQDQRQPTTDNFGAERSRSRSQPQSSPGMMV